MCIPQRFIIMFLMCIFSLTHFGQISSLGSVQHDLINMLNITSGQYSALFSVTSWTSLLDVIHGYIIERWFGLKLATYIYCGIAMLGSALYILAGFIRSFWLMVAGRAFFGLGCNPLFLCINCYIIHWFEGKEMNLMFGLLEGVIWLGSSISYYTVVHILHYFRSFPSAKENEALAATICSVTIIMSMAIALSSGIIAFLYNEKEKPISNSDEKEIQNNRTIKSLLNFQLIYWTYALGLFTFNICLLSFLAMSQDFFRNKYLVNVEGASNLSSLLCIIAFVFTPLTGITIDRIGRHLVFFAAAVITGMIAMVMFSYTTIPPAVPVVLWSFLISLSSCSFSLVQYFVGPHQYTVAYGIVQGGCQLSIAVGSMAAGGIVDKFGYGMLQQFYLALLASTLVLTMVTYYLDLRHGGLTTISAKERNARTLVKSDSDVSISSK